jgi:hypothetical protein
MSTEDRINEIAQAYEELIGRPSGARIRFTGGKWSGEVYPARDRNAPFIIKAEADSMDAVIAALGTAILAMAKAKGHL